MKVSASGASLSGLKEQKKNLEIKREREMASATALSRSAFSAPPSFPPSRRAARPPRRRRPLSANCALAGGPPGNEMAAEGEIIRQSVIPSSRVNGGGGIIIDRVTLKNDVYL